MSQTPQNGHINTNIHYPIKGVELIDLIEKRNVDLLHQMGNIDGIIDSLNSSTTNGIESSTIQQRIQQFGNNQFAEAARRSFFDIWKEALEDQTLLILIASAVVSLFLAFIIPHRESTCGGVEIDTPDYLEGIAILVAVCAVSLIGAWNDYSKQSKFIDIEKKEKNGVVKVIRDGIPIEIVSTELVVGDIVLLSIGDKIPADGIFIKGNNFRVDESEMTGESSSVKKSDENFYCLSGCVVTDGNGSILIVAVGGNSQWGLLKSFVDKDKQRPTPLQERLDDLAEKIGKMGMLAASIVFVVLTIWWMIKAFTFRGFVQNDDHCKVCLNEEDPNCVQIGFDWSRATDIVDYFIIAVTIVVVAVPEGLPLAVTVSLAYSMKQMFKDNNLVRHLKACETMSNCTTICSDKTGTLTENRMTVVSSWISGEVSDKIPTLEGKLKDLLAKNIALNSSLSSNVNSRGKTIGNKTECSLLLYLQSIGISPTAFRESNIGTHQQFAFTSERKRMDTILTDGTLLSKGAPELIINDCNQYLTNDGEILTLTEDLKTTLTNQISNWGDNGKRCLALSYNTIQSLTQFTEAPTSNSILLAIVALADPIRQEVPSAIESCKRAGITIRMVTGDNLHTALSVAKEVGIIEESINEQNQVLTGPEMSNLTDDEIDNKLTTLRVLARCSPMDKQRLVERLLVAGEIVAVTGDGTNDVAAFKEADVSLAMGLRGTDVAKQAADIVILDDNFASIVKSVVWGRCVFDNIRKFIQFQLTVNIVALTLCVIGAICQMGSPLNAMQMLWVNLIMDTMAALALGTEKPTPDLLLRKPFKRTDSLLSPLMIKKIALQVGYQLIILLGLLFFGSRISLLDSHCAYLSVIEDYPGKLYQCSDGSMHLSDQVIKDTTTMQTIIFNVFVLCQIFNEVNSRRVNGEMDIFNGLFTNYIFVGIEIIQIVVQVIIVVFLGSTFGVVPFPGITIVQWLFCLILSAITIPIGRLNALWSPQKVDSIIQQNTTYGYATEIKMENNDIPFENTIDNYEVEMEDIQEGTTEVSLTIN
ncbi:Calcium-transporting ATPase [Entamoeba marina]